jgi:hypothetical protein
MRMISVPWWSGVLNPYNEAETSSAPAATVLAAAEVQLGLFRVSVRLLGVCRTMSVHETRLDSIGGGKTDSSLAESLAASSESAEAGAR